MHVILDITEAQAKTIMDAAAFLSDDDPLKLTIVTAITVARQFQPVEPQGIPGYIHTGAPGHYTVIREE